MSRMMGFMRGLPGASAYEIAVANGFVGTEAEWLASIGGDGSGGMTDAERAQIEQAGTAATEALARPEIVDVPPSQPAMPYLGTAFARQVIDQVETRHPLVVGYQPLVDARAFGVVPVAISAAATEAQGIANRAAMQDAIDWSHETGGAIAHPGGSIDVRGSLVQRAGLSIFGAAPGACRIKQAQQPTSLAEGWTDLFTIAPVVNGATKADDHGGVGYVSFRGVHFHGGWDDLTSYQGAAEGWWRFAPARMTQRLIVWDTPDARPGNRVGWSRWRDRRA